MAKRFAGFTPEQMGKIVPEMQGMQGDEQAKYLAANPAAAARVGKMAELAQKRIGMAYGGVVKRGYAPGGDVNPYEQTFNTEFADFQKQLSGDMGFDPATIKSQADFDANKDKIEQWRSEVKDFLGSNQSYKNAQDWQKNYLTQQAQQGQRMEGLPEDQLQRIYHSTGDVTLDPVDPNRVTLDAAKQKAANAQNALTKAQQDLAANPSDQALVDAVTKAQADITSAQSEVQNATAAYSAGTGKSLQEMQASATGDPSAMVTEGKVATVSDADKTEGTIAAGTGQASATAPQATATEAIAAPDVAAPTVTPAATVTADTAEADVQAVMDQTQAAQGTVSADAQVQAAQGDPTQLAQLDLQAAQGQAATVQGAPTRQLETGEMISGTTVDQQKVQDIYGTDPLEAASVKDELDTLMQDFQGGATPAWAAGAMRAANAQMAARGLSASSMAGMAVVQAAMESALPIAQMDAANKQQVAVESAKQRAAFLNMEFNQEFETKVRNAAKISEIANMNFTAEQQVALENAKMAQTMNLANLSNRQAKVMADAAAMSQMDLTNLNNRQQAQVQNAKAFLQMDLANLDNKQQTAIFKAQQMTNTLLSDSAAENAARQFNASSQNQTDQFFANLSSQVERFNTEQANQISRFNAGEANAIDQFNASQKSLRDQFNANNALVVAQANAQWFQSITTAETAAQNQMNRDAAIQANKMTETAYNAAVQLERDTLSYAYRAAESELRRELEITLQGMRNEMKEADIQSQIDMARGGGTGKIIDKVLDAVLDWAF